MTAEIACLCLAGEAALTALKRSIHAFAEQTYEPCELLVGLTGDRPREAAIRRFVATLDGSEARIVTAATLAELAQKAGAPFLCAWSAVTISHPRRLEVQAAHLEASGAAACTLADRLLCRPGERTAYWLGGAEDCPPTAAKAGLLARATAFEPCRRKLDGGEWPVGEWAPLRLTGGGVLLAETGDGPPPAPKDCVGIEFGLSLLRQLGPAVDELALPRPLLIQARGDEDAPVKLDPYLGEAV